MIIWELLHFYINYEDHYIGFDAENYSFIFDWLIC